MLHPSISSGSDHSSSLMGPSRGISNLLLMALIYTWSRLEKVVHRRACWPLARGLRERRNIDRRWWRRGSKSQTPRCSIATHWRSRTCEGTRHRSHTPGWSDGTRGCREGASLGRGSGPSGPTEGEMSLRCSSLCRRSRRGRCSWCWDTCRPLWRAPWRRRTVHEDRRKSRGGAGDGVRTVMGVEMCWMLPSLTRSSLALSHKTFTSVSSICLQSYNYAVERGQRGIPAQSVCLGRWSLPFLCGSVISNKANCLRFPLLAHSRLSFGSCLENWIPREERCELPAVLGNASNHVISEIVILSGEHFRQRAPHSDSALSNSPGSTRLASKNKTREQIKII